MISCEIPTSYIIWNLAFLFPSSEIITNRDERKHYSVWHFMADIWFTSCKYKKLFYLAFHYLFPLRNLKLTSWVYDTSHSLRIQCSDQLRESPISMDGRVCQCFSFTVYVHGRHSHCFPKHCSFIVSYQ